MLAGTVMSNARTAMTIEFLNRPLWMVKPRSHRSGTRCVMFFSLMASPFRFSSHSSKLIRSNGTHRPVKRNAARMPIAASIPKLRKAAISEKRFAEKAAMVVIDVSMIARPTRVSVMVPDSEALLPSLRSSLYRCKAWRESSMPKARTKIGSRFEN